MEKRTCDHNLLPFVDVLKENLLLRRQKTQNQRTRGLFTGPREERAVSSSWTQGIETEQARIYQRTTRGWKTCCHHAFLTFNHDSLPAGI